MPWSVEISAAYPNPFNPETRFDVTLPSEGRVILTITDLLGRIVHREDAGVRPAGRHPISWKAAGVTSGVYFYTCEAWPVAQGIAPVVRSGKVILAK
jgi:hypothetical protein